MRATMLVTLIFLVRKEHTRQWNQVRRSRCGNLWELQVSAGPVTNKGNKQAN